MEETWLTRTNRCRLYSEGNPLKDLIISNDESSVKKAQPPSSTVQDRRHRANTSTNFHTTDSHKQRICYERCVQSERLTDQFSNSMIVITISTLLSCGV